MDLLPYRLQALTAFFLVLILSTTSYQVAADPPTFEADQEHFVTWHRRGIDATFIDNSTTNTTDLWVSAVRPWGVVSVWIVGVGIHYNLTDGLGNYSSTGTTNSSLTIFEMAAPDNVSALWPILLLTTENLTGENVTWEILNFGQMVVGYERAVITEDVLPDTVLTTVAQRLLFQSILATAVLLAMAALVSYQIINYAKRRRTISE